MPRIPLKIHINLISYPSCPLTSPARVAASSLPAPLTLLMLSIIITLLHTSCFKKSIHTKIAKILSADMTVLVLCLITALTLQARLSNGRRTFLSDFLVSLSGRSRKVDIRSMLLETRTLCVLYGKNFKLRQLEACSHFARHARQGRHESPRKKSPSTANSRAGVLKPLEDTTDNVTVIRLN